MAEKDHGRPQLHGRGPHATYLIDAEGTVARRWDKVKVDGHAEEVLVPKNLVVPIPEGVGADEAAFATLGAIALQSVRILEPRLGEEVAVVGLGLLGLIATQLLRAAG